MTLNEAITAAQAARKSLLGAGGAVVTEQADVTAERAILAVKLAALQTAFDAEVALKSAYKSVLVDLRAATDAEIAGLS